MGKLEKKDVIDTCPIQPNAFFTECHIAGIEVKEQDKTTVVKVWECK